ncbi:hypothetical protein V1264_002805 [Littorina saxatilis]|uniref:PDZ domain-containing protein n=1 Tax=Littorina saxatilis TaxID=31220 RepID=A0AAN9B3G0_9CAEN
MGDGGDTAQLVPRLCHIVRWSDFNGYGFNLHAEKGKAGQFIGKVDEGSPAVAAGLKQGDRIVEVNGTNIGNENHQQVVARIKAGGDETRLLVVDAETDQYYKDDKRVVRGDLPEVLKLTALRDGQIESSEAEPAVTVSSGSYNYDDTTNGNGDADESSRYPPRLCHLCKWPDFDGYGFNLHAEKDKPGQYIGSVDPDSPAEVGGLKENDRIIEVNGDNIESQTHSVVIQKIKSGGTKTTLLVLDRESDKYYKSRGQTVSRHMSNVIVFTTPPRDETETITATVSETVESAPAPEPDSFQNEEAEEEFPPPIEDDVAVAVAAVAIDDDDDVVAAEEEVGGGGVDMNAYEEVQVTRTTYDQDFGTASNGINGGSESFVPEPEPEPVAVPEPEPIREPEPEAAVIRSTTTAVEATPTPTPASGDLNLGLSAAEMKERLKSRKRVDPRLQKTSFEAKHKMFERM